MGEPVQEPKRRGHGHDVLRVRRGVRLRGEAAHTRAHVDHQGVHHQRQARAVLRGHAHVRREADRRHQVAKRAHRAPGRRREALGADVPAHGKQPAKRHLQPRRALLRPHRQPGAQGR